MFHLLIGKLRLFPFHLSNFYLLYFPFVRLCLFLSRCSLLLAGTARVTRSEHHSGQSPPCKCGELARARGSPADVAGRQPMEPLRTKSVVVSREDLVNL